MRASRGIEFWKEHSQAYDAGTQTRAEYCAKHKLSMKTFARWRSTIKREAKHGLQKASSNAPSQLIRVDAEGLRSSRSPGPGAARPMDAGIALRGSDWEIRIDVGFDVDSLFHLLRALRHC